MCGIWACLSTSPLSVECLATADVLKLRGPSSSMCHNLHINDLYLYLRFYRLAIRDLSSAGDQPFVLTTDTSTIYLMCNGEIYNYQYLVEKYNLPVVSKSDCECLIHLYNKIGLDGLYAELTEGNDVSGEFAIIIVDINNSTGLISISTCRDPGGVRPLYESRTDSCLIYSSELKAIPKPYGKVEQFPPYQYKNYTFTSRLSAPSPSVSSSSSPASLPPLIPNSASSFRNSFSTTPIVINDEPTALEAIRNVLTQCVSDRLASDVPIAFLLSGGLDSSLCTAIGCRLSNDPGSIHTVSVGMLGGTDETYAKLVADYLGCSHHHILCAEDDFLHRVEETIRVIESYDITTVRASVGQLIASEAVTTTPARVVVIGDYSDEVTGGYRETGLAPTTADFNNRIHQLVDEIYLYDAQRADRCISHYGLEARCPFGDHRFIRTYLSIDPELRRPRNGVAKYLLRKAFEGYLPDSVLWRPKEAFSDGVSSETRSWYEILGDKYADYQSNDDYVHLPPYTGESRYYRDVFCKYYSDLVSNVIPHFWLPKWGNSTDPSARTLQPQHLLHLLHPTPICYNCGNDMNYPHYLICDKNRTGKCYWCWECAEIQHINSNTMIEGHHPDCNSN